MVEVKVAQTPDEAMACFPVMKQLRPHLTEAEFRSRLKSQAAEGYTLAYAMERNRVVAVAGYRLQNMLYQSQTGRMLYVDDLVTDGATRSSGHGRTLLSWLVEEAKRKDCDALELDSGVQRVGAHRFYLGQGMHISSYHFRIPLRTPAPRVLTFASAAPEPGAGKLTRKS